MKAIHKRRLTRGLTTIEFAVSGTIMVGVMVLSFDVMATGVQVTKKAQNDSVANEQNRAVLDRFVKDVQTAEAIMPEFSFGSRRMETSINQVILRIPKFSANGTRLNGQYEIVGYEIDPEGTKKKPMIRRSVQTSGMSVFGLKKEQVATDVDKLIFYFGRNETLSYDVTSGRFLLPAKDENKFDVTANRIRLSRARLSWNGKIYNTRESLWAAPGFSMAHKKFSLGGAKAGDNVDVMYCINPTITKATWPFDCKANMVQMQLKLKMSETGTAQSAGNSELMTSANIRNGGTQ